MDEKSAMVYSVSDKSGNVTITVPPGDTGTTNSDELDYVISDIVKFQIAYSGIHGYLAVCVCIFGFISNLLNIIVLTRKHMICPTNCILTALAIADMLTMASYLSFALYLFVFTVPKDFPYSHSLVGINFVIICTHFFITCHVWAMWLTVDLAIFRYIFVCHHSVAPQLCTMERAKLTIAIVIGMSTVMCVPEYFLYETYPAYEINPAIPSNHTGYWLGQSQFIKQEPFLQKFCFMLYGIVMKMITCILLTILSALLIYAMKQATIRRNRLLQRTHRFNDHPPNEHNRTTIMLVSVVLFFVLTEFPQGILALVSGFDNHFFENVYGPIGDLLDMFVLVNSALNFILYCAMSQQFRQTFKNLFLECLCPKFFGRKLQMKENGTSTSNHKTEITQV